MMPPGRGGVMTDYRLSDYDRERQRELNSGNLALFWLAFFPVVFGGMWLLIQVLDWLG